MKALELCTLLETILTRPGTQNDKDLSIVIKTSERCLSCGGVVEVESVVEGFDWHKNELIIVPKKELVPKESHRDVPKKPYSGLCPECENTLKKGWKYCPRCGKAIDWSL